MKEKERSMAKPSNLKGKTSSHTMGYKMMANKASGQQITIRISQSKKVAMVFFVIILSNAMPSRNSFEISQKFSI
jgi:hypothetical protein